MINASFYYVYIYREAKTFVLMHFEKIEEQVLSISLSICGEPRSHVTSDLRRP